MADFVEVPYGRTPRPSNGPVLLGDYEAYECPVTGKPVEGRYAHSENLKRQNCRLLEPGESRDAMKRQEQQFESDLRKTLNYWD